MLQELTYLLSLQSVRRDICDESDEMHLPCHGHAQSDPLPSSDGEQLDCTICWSNVKASVLPCCRHSLCSECESRWVRKKLICPFCRTQFPSRKAVKCSSWELTKWDYQEELEKEIETIQKKIDSFWLSFAERKPSIGSIVREMSYIEVPRRLAITDDHSCSDLVVVHMTEGDTTVPPYYISFRQDS